MRETSCNVLTFPYILGPTQLDMNKPRVLHIFINILSILLVQMLYSHKYPRIVLYEPFYTNNMMMIIIIDSLAHAIFYNHPFDPRTQANEFQFLFCLKQLKHNNYKTHDVHIYITKNRCTCVWKVSMFFTHISLANSFSSLTIVVNALCFIMIILPLDIIMD